MAATAEIKAVISAEDRASDQIEGFGSRIAGVGRMAAVGAAVAGAALVGFGAASVKAFSESEDAAAQLNAVLKSTGGVAGVTADQANSLASSLQKTTRFSDEAVLSAENLLLTFTNIGKDIFPDATKTVLDMSTALGQDTKASAIQLGKALQDPILGVTALRRVGVNFTEAQQDVIKKLVETGQSAEAQRLIMEELKKEFGGSAEAAGKTFAGQLIILKNTFGDLMEVIGGGIVTAIQPFANSIQNFVDNNGQRLTETIGGMASGFGEFVQKVADLAINIGEFLRPKVEELIASLQVFWHEVLEPLMPLIGTTLVVAIASAIDALGWLINRINENKEAFWAIMAVIALWKTAMIITTVVTAFSTGIQSMIGSLALMRGAFAATSGGFAAMAGVLANPLTIVIAAAVAALLVIRKEIADTEAAFDRLEKSMSDAQASEDAFIRSTNSNPNLTPEQKRKRIGDFYARRNAADQGRQHGGPVMANQPYLVGERGPEVIVPSGSGSVIPNNRLGSGGTINLNVNIGMYAGTPMERREIAQRLFDDMQDVASSKGMTLNALMGAS